jgi:hypothetical protein
MLGTQGEQAGQVFEHGGPDGCRGYIGQAKRLNAHSKESFCHAAAGGILWPRF